MQEDVGNDPCTLYVRGLEANVDHDRLEAMFLVLHSAPSHHELRWVLNIIAHHCCPKANIGSIQGSCSDGYCQASVLLHNVDVILLLLLMLVLMLPFSVHFLSATWWPATAAGCQEGCALQAFGPVISCRILTDPKTGMSRCAGLLRFETPEKAMRAIRDMHSRQVRLRQWDWHCCFPHAP